MDNLFVTAEDVIEIAFASANLDPAYIKENIIYEVQRDRLYNFLGKEYYAELVAESATTYTAANQIIADFIGNALAFFIKAKISPDLAVKSTNAGFISNTTEFGVKASKSEVEAVITSAEASGTFWLQSAKDYMTDPDYSDNYPTYNASTTSDVANNRGNLLGGMMLD